MRAYRFVLPALLAVALAACGSEKSGSLETEEGDTGTYTIDPETGESAATITTEDGTASFRSGEGVKADLPDGWTIYPGASVVSATNIDGVEGKGTLVTMRSPDSVEEVVGHYLAEAQAAGLAIAMDMTLADGRIVAGKSRDGLQFSLKASRGEEATEAQLMVARDLGG